MISSMIAEIIYDGELSTTAYIILALMFLLIIGGLFWCFYRAIVAANKGARKQHPDEI
ncbi:MAG: hypothetical protein JXD22_00275 [Sedimentisphaerales bacterium]|nr:hypothetical protein [Sedimentisphaerales bacterium]